MQVIDAAKKLAARAKKKGQLSDTIPAVDVEDLCEQLRLEAPPWLTELFPMVPLSGLELGWQADEPEPDFDGVAWMQWSDAANIRSESAECFPGCAILTLGYLNVASCAL